MLGGSNSNSELSSARGFGMFMSGARCLVCGAVQGSRIPTVERVEPRGGPVIDSAPDDRYPPCAVSSPPAGSASGHA